MLAGFGLELAGRAAAKLAGTLRIAVHLATVLRLVVAAAEPEVTAAARWRPRAYTFMKLSRSVLKASL
jgi:hypothetical protein